MGQGRKMCVRGGARSPHPCAVLGAAMHIWAGFPDRWSRGAPTGREGWPTSGWRFKGDSFKMVGTVPARAGARLARLQGWLQWWARAHSGKLNALPPIRREDIQIWVTNLNHGQDTRANRTRHTSSSTQSHAKQQHTNATKHTSRSHAQIWVRFEGLPSNVPWINLP